MPCGLRQNGWAGRLGRSDKDSSTAIRPRAAKQANQAPPQFGLCSPTSRGSQAMSSDLIHVLIATMFAGVWAWVGHIVVARD